MNSLRMKIAALASVAGLGALGGYALSSNTGTSAPTQAALTRRPKPKVKTQVMHRTVHVKPEHHERCSGERPAWRRYFDPASGTRRSPLPRTRADVEPGRVGVERLLFERRDVPAGRDPHERLERRLGWRLGCHAHQWHRRYRWRRSRPRESEGEGGGLTLLAPLRDRTQTRCRGRPRRWALVGVVSPLRRSRCRRESRAFWSSSSCLPTSFARARPGDRCRTADRSGAARLRGRGQPTSGSSGAVVTSASGASTASFATHAGPRHRRAPAQPASHSIATRTGGGGHVRASSASWRRQVRARKEGSDGPSRPARPGVPRNGSARP